MLKRAKRFWNGLAIIKTVALMTTTAKAMAGDPRAKLQVMRMTEGAAERARLVAEEKRIHRAVREGGGAYMPHVDALPANDDYMNPQRDNTWLGTHYDPLPVPEEHKR